MDEQTSKNNALHIFLHDNRTSDQKTFIQGLSQVKASILPESVSLSIIFHSQTWNQDIKASIIAAYKGKYAIRVSGLIRSKIIGGPFDSMFLVTHYEEKRAEGAIELFTFTLKETTDQNATTS